jgi:hypothetical protein
MIVYICLKLLQTPSVAIIAGSKEGVSWIIKKSLLNQERGATHEKRKKREKRKKIR